MALSIPTKRTRFTRRIKSSADSDALAALTISLSHSTCRTEDRFWESKITDLLVRLFRSKDEAAITSALDNLHTVQNQAYGDLVDLVEACAESLPSDTSPMQDLVLIAIPVLAWSRYHIPSGKVAPATLADLRVHIQAHLLAQNPHQPNDSGVHGKGHELTKCLHP